MNLYTNINIIHRKIFYKELDPFWKAISSIRYAVIKGEVLSQQIYGLPDKRKSGDIDILVDKRNLKYIENELRKLNFKQENHHVERQNRIMYLTYSHQIPTYRKEKFHFPLEVDINHDIFWGEYDGKRYSIDEFLCDTVETTIYGQKIKTLNIEKSFVQLILHHYKEMNSLYHLSKHNCICTHKFRDIYDLISYNKKVLTVEKVKKLCEEYSIGKYVYYMIYYTNQVWYDPMWCEYLRELKCYKDVQLLSSYGLSVQERKKWMIPFFIRLNKNNIWDNISNELNDNDIKKINTNTTIFG